MAPTAAVKALPILVGPLDESRAPELVVGRTELVARFWDAVRGRCVCVRGARHMGKTWALKLAAARRPEWAQPVLLDAGSCQTVPELVWSLAQGLGRAAIVPRDWYLRVEQWHRKQTSRDANGRPAAPWAMVLNGTLQHASVSAGPKTPAIILDGFGAFVHRMCAPGSLEIARRVIDAVAAFPNDWPRLRCIISGSVEFDEALGMVYGDASRSGIQSAFDTFEIPPLSHDDAHYLAACLLQGESVLCSDLHEVADAVATSTGENAFLIHNTIDWMARFQPGMWTPDRVRDVPTALWIEPPDGDDTAEDEISLQPNEADEELARAASVLETMAMPAPRPAAPEKPHVSAPRVLTLPPAFVLFKDQPASGTGTGAGKHARQRPDASPVARMWRRVQPLARVQSFLPTMPASFYVTHGSDGPDARGRKNDPPSFVALSGGGAMANGMQALAEARRTLLDLEETTEVLGIENDEALFRRGSNHLERAEYDFALREFQDLARRSRGGESAEIAASALLNISYTLARLRRHGESIGVVDALVRKYGEEARPNVLACVAMGLVNKGASLIALGRGTEALDVCRALQACSPPEPESIFTEAITSAQFNAAYALAQLGQEDDAVAAYVAVAGTCGALRAGGMRTLAADAHFNAAILHMTKERRAKAVRSCESAMALDARHARAHSLRTVCYLELHLIGEALASLSDAFQAFPADSLQRVGVVAAALRAVMGSPAIFPLIVPRLGQDPAVLAHGIILWLQRLVPIDPDLVPQVNAAESALRPLCGRDPNVLSALDAVRAASCAAVGNLSALETMPEDFRSILR